MRSIFSEITFWEIRNKVYSFFLKNFIPYNELLENIINELNLKTNLFILDAGCGAGLFERKLVEKKISDIKIEAIDFSEKILQIAKRNNRDFNNITFRKIDLNEKLEYPDQTFDVIVCINVLNFLKRPKNTLLEFYRIMKKGGKIVLTVPNYNFNYLILFKEHFLKRKGIFKKIKDIILFPFFLLIILPFEFFITIKEIKKDFKRFNKEEIMKLFSLIPFKNFKLTYSYANQNLVVIAEK